MSAVLKVKEFAARLNIAERTAWKMVYRRQVSVNRIGRSVRIPESEVERILDESLTPARTA